MSEEVTGQPGSDDGGLAVSVSDFTWRANLGARASLTEIARVLSDLQELIQLGERWSRINERERLRAATWRTIYDEGPEGFARLAESLDIAISDLDVALIYRFRWPSPYMFEAPRSVEKVVDAQIMGLDFAPLRPARLTYENPLSVLFTGLLSRIPLTIKILEFTRDFKAKKRMAAADASIAEAEARRANLYVDTEEFLLKDLCERVKNDLDSTSALNLLEQVKRREMRAISRLSSLETTIELDAHGADPSRASNVNSTEPGVAD